MYGDYEMTDSDIARKDNYDTGYSEGYSRPTTEPQNENKDYRRGFEDGAQDRIWELQHPFSLEAIDNFPDLEE